MTRAWSGEAQSGSQLSLEQAVALARFMAKVSPVDCPVDRDPVTGRYIAAASKRLPASTVTLDSPLGTREPPVFEVPGGRQEHRKEAPAQLCDFGDGGLATSGQGIQGASPHIAFHQMATNGAWLRVKDGDARARALYRRHYSRHIYRDGRNPAQFVGPGEHIVLLTPECDALFIWRKFKDGSGQQGVNCACFRNEGPRLSSQLIVEACDIAWRRWPGERLYTYVNASAIASPNPGYCFKVAGWRFCGRTKGNLDILSIAFQPGRRTHGVPDTVSPIVSSPSADGPHSEHPSAPLAGDEIDRPTSANAGR